ncbi:MAG: hypothetical protein Q9208_004014 [Pyrenodesmia sp. 3 TL-2023]
MAQQVLGRLLYCYEPGELKEEERTWAAVRVQSACRDLICAQRWEEEEPRVRAASASMETVIRRAMLAYSWSEQDGVKDVIEGKDLRRCEAWLHQVVLPSAQWLLDRVNSYADPDVGTGPSEDEGALENSSDIISTAAMVDAPVQEWLLTAEITMPADEGST